MPAPPAPPRPPLLGEAALVVFLLFGYDRVAAAANVDPATAYRHGRALLALERFCHLAVELPFDHALAAWHRLGQLASVYYDFAHGVVTFGVLGLLYLLAPGVYRRERTALLLVNLVALVVFWLLPVAPPRLLAGAGFVDVVAGSGTWGAWEAGASAISEHADRFASLPSLHVAWAAWVLRAVCTAGAARRWRVLSGVHLLLTVVIVVATGNHYVVDVLGGAALAEGAWWAAPLAGLRAPVAGLRRLAALTGGSRR